MILSVLLIRSETLQAEIGVNIKFSIIFRLAKPASFRYKVNILFTSVLGLILYMPSADLYILRKPKYRSTLGLDIYNIGRNTGNCSV